MAVKDKKKEIVDKNELGGLDLEIAVQEGKEEILEEEKVLFEWEAVERPFQQRDKDFWITAIAILVLVSVVLIFIKEFYLIVALISLLFLYYVMSTVPPEKIKSKITNRGVYFGELKYDWVTLSRFWFKKNLSSRSLEFETRLKFPRTISLVIAESDEEMLTDIVSKKIPHLDYSPSFTDKLTRWFSERLPLESREEEKK